jgi:2-oxoglutarate dehydrogenase complex dehydrogenase (E1) component-like enzyme
LQVGYALTKVPDGFTLHKGVKRVYEQRRQMIDSGEGIDWGTAEALAFGTLLSEGAAFSGGTKESSHVPLFKRTACDPQWCASLAHYLASPAQGQCLLDSIISHAEAMAEEWR